MTQLLHYRLFKVTIKPVDPSPRSKFVGVVIFVILVANSPQLSLSRSSVVEDQVRLQEDQHKCDEEDLLLQNLLPANRWASTVIAAELIGLVGQEAGGFVWLSPGCVHFVKVPNY